MRANGATYRFWPLIGTACGPQRMLVRSCGPALGSEETKSIPTEPLKFQVSGINQSLKVPPAQCLSHSKNYHTMAAAAAPTAPPWPRLFRVNPQIEQKQPKSVQFDPSFYKGPQNQTPQIFYSDNYADSQRLAQSFLTETVLGFDMEWVWPERETAPLQERIALIQIASEDKIALFHI